MFEKISLSLFIIFSALFGFGQKTDQSFVFYSDAADSFQIKPIFIAKDLSEADQSLIKFHAVEDWNPELRADLKAECNDQLRAQWSANQNALYHYILGISYVLDSTSSALINFQKAYELYYRIKDIEGQFFSSYYIFFNSSISGYETDSRKNHLTELITLSEKSNYNGIKLAIIDLTLSEPELMNITITEELLDSIWLVIDRIYDGKPKKLEYATIMDLLSNNYRQLGKLKKAITISELMLEIVDSSNPYYYIIYANLGLDHIKDGQEKVGMKYLSEALKKNTDHKQVSAMKNNTRLTERIANIYFDKNKVDSAYHYLKKSLAYQKELTTLVIDQKQFEAEKKYNVARKELELDTSKKLEQEAQMRFKVTLTASILLLLSLLFAFVLLFRLKKVNAKLDKAVKGRDKLITIIAHDLSSPLNMYQGLAQSLAYAIEQKDWDQLQKIGKYIDQVGISLSHLLSNMLEWGLHQLGHNKQTQHVENMSVFINGLTQPYLFLAQQNSIRLTVQNQLDDNENLNKNDFAIILRNLLDNVIKYSETDSNAHVVLKRSNGKIGISLSSVPKAKSLEKLKSIISLIQKNEKLDMSNNQSGFGWINIQYFLHKLNGKIEYQTQDQTLVMTLSFSF